MKKGSLLLLLMSLIVLVIPVRGQPGKIEAPEEEITVYGEQRQRMQTRKDERALAKIEEELRRRFGLNHPSPSPDRLLDTGVSLSNCASIDVATKPMGAEVYLDGRLLGATPLAASKLPGGRHVLALRHTGYELWSASVLLPPWGTARISTGLDRRIRYELETVWDTEKKQQLPSGLTVLKPGNVLVSGGGVVRLWTRGRAIRQFKVDGMTDPRGMGLSPLGRLLYVADPGCHAVWYFETATGRFMGKIEGNGGQQLHQPTDVAVAEDGRILVCDSGNHRLVWFDQKGNPLEVWGGAETGMFRHPEGVALAEDGKVYVADWGNNRIQVLSPSGEVMWSFGARGMAPGQFRGPTSVCLEEGGYLLVVDSLNDRVQRFRRDGTVVSVLPEARGLGQFTKPFSAALDPAGVVYVTQRDRHGVLVLRQMWQQAYVAELGLLRAAGG